MTGESIGSKTFQRIPAFRGLNESECHQLVDVAQSKTFAPGERVIEQGQSSQSLWILLEGQCEVVKNSQHDGAVVLAELEPFSLFGEMSFFSPAPHSANVVAKTPVKLLSIARADYDDLIRDGVTAAYKLAYNVVESVAGRLRRMDDWVTELLTNHENQDSDKKPQREWGQFRRKMFETWNL